MAERVVGRQSSCVFAECRPRAVNSLASALTVYALTTRRSDARRPRESRLSIAVFARAYRGRESEREGGGKATQTRHCVFVSGGPQSRGLTLRITSRSREAPMVNTRRIKRRSGATVSGGSSFARRPSGMTRTTTARLLIDRSVGRSIWSVGRSSGSAGDNRRIYSYRDNIAGHTSGKRFAPPPLPRPLSLSHARASISRDTRNRSISVPQELLLDIAPLIALARKRVDGQR